jgi:prophage tail gpP-like protein
MADPPIRVPIYGGTTEAPPPPGNPAALQSRNKEIATIVVNGRNFTNWTSMRCEVRWGAVASTFMFELTEQSPIPLHWYQTDLAPGAKVQVFLGDYLAITGIVLERHVSYDASMHGVRLIGESKTTDTKTSTPPLDKIGGHDNKSLQQIASSLVEHLGIGVRTVGDVSGMPFENAHVQPGETIITTIERYAKMRQVMIGNDAKGNLLLIGKNDANTPDAAEHLAEGKNILRANAVVRDEYKYRNMVALGQQHGNDKHNGDQTTKQTAFATGTSDRNRWMVFPAEISDDKQGLQLRVDMEKQFSEGSEIEAHISVQGWFRKEGQPWRAGDYYFVESPSLLLNRMLGCNVCTYEQSDGGGTTTTLTMVKPQHMNGREGAMLSTSGNPQPSPPVAPTDAEPPASFNDRFTGGPR